MERILSIIMLLSIVFTMTTGCSAQETIDPEDTLKITMQIGNPIMTVDDEQKEIDPDRGTAPILRNGRTLLPIRAVVEAMGGSVEWNENIRTIQMKIDDKTIILEVGSNIGLINSEEKSLDAAPIIENNRTMLPIRFIAEGFDFNVNWEEETQIVTITKDNSEKKAVGAFNFETKSVMLNNGYEMPIMGLGTYSLSDEECAASTRALLEAGGRLIDTAYMYHNEAAVGKAIRESTVPRKDIFVITKLYPNQFSNANEAIDEALERMGLDYIDMMLLHHPGSGDVEAYKAMEQAVADGKIRSIGLSNWYVEELQEFLPQISITPALVQNEIHPYYQENEVIPYIQDLGIVVQGWYPLGGRGHTAELLGDTTIFAIAKAHGVSSAQVILRWNLQKGVVVIPGSSNPKHIRENLDLFGFELTENEMAQINALDRDEKHDWY